MFRTKKDVDRHVQDVLRKVKSETERNLRCYNIAQQYFKVKDYESAKNYLSLYLSVKEDSPLAHKLQGQIWEGIGDKVRALNAYKTSLEYEANQPELVLKMCELLCETDVAMDTDRAHYWCERGADLFPHDPAVFRLKEKLLKLGGQATKHAFEELINSEVKARPNDVGVRTKLMQLYLETGRTKAAFNHAVELEATQTFYKELGWYECLAQVCQSYADEFPSLVDWQFYCTWVTVLDRVASLSLSELSTAKKLVDCTQAIFSMDQILFKAANVTVPREYSELYLQFVKHMSAQLCLHITTLILKRAKKEPSNWREATRAVSTVLFLAMSPPPDTEAPWCMALKPNWKRNQSQWVNDALYRVSQAGYTLLGLAKNSGNQFTDKVTHMATGNWRERIYQRVFMVLDHRAGVTTSQFVQSELLAKISVRLPTHDAGVLRTRQIVPVYEKVRDTLHHLVWLGLEIARHNENKLPVDFHTYNLTRLKFTTHNLTNMSPETLSVLDVDAFLYTTVLCAAAIIEGEVLSGFYSTDRPMTLPADISNLLCTQAQMSWWVSACQVNTQKFSSNTNLVLLRQQLQRGLEVVRVDGNHGLDVQLIVKLARTFADRAESVNGKSSDQYALEDRASMYWNAAIPLLEKMERNQGVRISNSKLFEYPRKELSMAEVCSLLEEGRYFVACQLMKSEQHERAIEAFKPLRSPYASYNQALIYKKLAAAELEERPREEITSEMRSKHVILLSKARECLNVTRERIRIDRRHPLHQILPDHVSEVEAALSRIEPDPDMDRNVLGTPRSLDLSMQHLGMSFHSSNLNRSDAEANISEGSVSTVGSPAAGDMGQQPRETPRLNGRANRYSSTPRCHHHTHSEYRHQNNNGDLVDVGKLLQIQTLHEEMKKMDDKLEIIMENMKELRRDMNRLKPPGAEELYIFGDEEEYPEDVLGGQYPPPFVPSYPAVPQPAPSFYPQHSRGVQGTSTVTYGAPPPTQQPPVIPLIPMRVPIDPALAGYQASQNLAFYNQGALPFAETPHLPDFLRQTIPKPVLPHQLPPPPVNVVITTSDTLPTGPPPVQPTLSVTIPPQHRLGTLPISTPTTPTPPHKFQITMPPTATIPTLDKSPIAIPDEVESEDDNEVAYDPCPDFRPIIPLPNEVSVTTGEEDDDVLFEKRAKLFRFIEKEWKERGVGVVKILKNRITDKVRLLMRRDQVHKVCANHLLKADMELSMLKNSDRALVWVANDFAEEVVQLEKFCIKFKTSEEARTFEDVFNDAKMKYGHSPQKNVTLAQNREPDSNVKVNVGGFTFTSPPKLKEPKDDKMKAQDEIKKDTPSKPFAAFTFTPQKSIGNESFAMPGSILKQPVLSQPLFAGLNSTQNKHSLFENEQEEFPYQPDVSQKDTVVKGPSDTSPKVILKAPILTSFQPFAQTITVSSEKKDGDSNVNIQKLRSTENASSESKHTFNFSPQANLFGLSPKETPKSILKESPAINQNTPSSLINNAKPPGAAKHVLFQDTTFDPSNQQTSTLASLLSTPQTPVVDFAALSKMNENKTQFVSNSKSSGFEGAGSTVFGNSRARNDSEGENAEEFVPSTEFKPVVPLPELVDIKTGEEGQEVLFNERAKLMRFDADNKEWKERGLGQMKILKDPNTGVTRFLMRREQVLKVCCNHRIIQTLELKASPSSEKAWTWYAVDYAEGEMKNELFAIRFKTVELAKTFKETVERVQKKLREEGTPKRSCPDSASQEEISSNNVWKCQDCLFPNSVDSRVCKACSKPKTLPKLSEMFRPKTGSWECKACYTINGSKDSTCVSCDSLREKTKSPITLSKVNEKTTVQMPSLAEMFKPKEGSWECSSCYVRNEVDKTICPVCNTPKPGHEVDTKESKSSCTFSFDMKPSDNKGTGFSFGIKPSQDKSQQSTFTFGVKPSASENKENMKAPVAEPGFTFGQTNIAKAASPFTFASKAEIVASSADSTSSGLGEKPLSATGTFKFGNMAEDASDSSKASFTFGSPVVSSLTKGDADKFSFGKSDKFEFCFSGVKSPSGNKSPKSPGHPVAGQETDSEPEDIEEEADQIVFQPIVPLPDKVPLTTGEEDEEVLYSHRAKLFRFAQGEWKERGVGDIKILRHNTTHRIRLLMRREPILKICLNHFLTEELTFTPKDDKSWLWSSPDFAEGKVTNENLCLRLKSPEIASEFKAAIESAQGELKKTSRCERSATASSELPKTATHGDDDKFAFGKSDTFKFSFGGVKTPSSNKSPLSSAAGQDTDSQPEHIEKEADHTAFQPIVPLPDKVPVTTGEEDEEVLYSNRAKLFRFAQGAWKERGTGDIKILLHNTTHRIRLLMRCETALKICLNHFLTEELTFTSKDEKSWLWSSPDFAEGTVRNEQFCLRFQTPEKAAEFKAAIQSAQESLNKTKTGKSCPATASCDSTSRTAAHEVEIVFEAKMSEELRQKALRLQLPPNFYSYMNKEPCSGCAGCEPDSEGEEFKPNTLTSPTANPTADSSASVKATSVVQPFTFTVKTTTSTTASSVFGVATTHQSVVTTMSTPLLSTPTNVQSGFSFSLNTPSTQPATLFGNTSFFGETPPFQSQPVNKISTQSDPPLLFGATPAPQSATTLSFGNTQNTTSLFEGSAANQSSKSPFGSVAYSSANTPSIFGGSGSQSLKNIFATPPTPPFDNSSPKGVSFFSNLHSFQSPQISLFGGTSPRTPASLFGALTTASDVTQSSGTLFSTPVSTTHDTSSESGPKFLFQSATTFSDISSKPAFGLDGGSSNFSWAGAGSVVFGGKTNTPKQNNAESGEESGGEEADTEAAHDPVFEPIVPLPDAIEVRTGEEEEEKEFCNRAKFFRYNSDTKEWKERGVGEMKILRHVKNNTYRLLLRRDQVHKVVCNQLITADMEFQTIASSDKSYCWAGMNMAEEYSEPQLEKVAVRFKDTDIANKFKRKLEECIAVVKDRKKKAISEALDSSAEVLEPVIDIEEADSEEEGEDGEYNDEEYLEGEESEPMFEKRAIMYVREHGGEWCKISQGELSISYNNDMNLGNIIFKKDNGEPLLTCVGPESNAQLCSKKEVMWLGYTYDETETLGELTQELKAEFCTSGAADEFLAILNEVMELSQTFGSSYQDSETEGNQNHPDSED